MIIACPSCSTKFRIKPDAIGTGKNLTCAKCKHKWFFQLPTADPVVVPAPETPPEAVAPLTSVADTPTAAEIETAIAAIATAHADQNPPVDAIAHLAAQTDPAWQHQPRGWLNTWRATAIVVGVIGILLVSSILARTSITTMWPPAHRIFSALGLGIPVLAEGLVLNDLRFTIPQELVENPDTGGIEAVLPKTLNLSGTIYNSTADALPLPELAVTMTSSDGIVLHHGEYAPPSDRILGDETLPFTASLPLVRDQDITIAVTFDDGSGVKTTTANKTDPVPTDAAPEIPIEPMPADAPAPDHHDESPAQ